jgi:hypothetical protein
MSSETITSGGGNCMFFEEVTWGQVRWLYRPNSSPAVLQQEKITRRYSAFGENKLHGLPVVEWVDVPMVQEPDQIRPSTGVSSFGSGGSAGGVPNPRIKATGDVQPSFRIRATSVAHDHPTCKIVK